MFVCLFICSNLRVKFCACVCVFSIEIKKNTLTIIDISNGDDISILFFKYSFFSMKKHGKENILNCPT